MTYRVRNPELFQEDDRVSAWRVLFAIGVTLAVSAIMVVWAVSANAAHEAALRPSGAFPERWLGPRHMVSGVREDLFGEQRGVSFLGEQRALLAGYGVVDPERRIVRVPIDLAIDLVVSGRRP
jgi:hypothetical protein